MAKGLDSARQQLNQYWDGLDTRHKRSVIIIASLILIFIVVVTLVMGQKDYVVLYSGLDDQESAEIYSKLKELGAEPRLRGRSTIMVPRDREAELRMQLTLEGYPKSGFNYDLYLQNSGFGQTDEEMKKRWIIQLQERLSNTICLMEGIQDAVVTIAMPETDSFVLKSHQVPVTASVIVLPKSGWEMTATQAKSIEQLVAKSVPGLKGENVSIIDNKMNVLNSKSSESNELVSEKFDLQLQLEERIKTQVKELLEPVFGYGKVKTAVSVDLNFDKRVKESVTFEPVEDDAGIIVSQELLKEKVSSSSSGGIAGESSNTTQYPQSAAGENSLSQKEHKKINYEINEIKEKIEEQQGKLEKLSIAVVIDSEELDQQTITQVKELVAKAIGTDITRVAVQNWSFNTDMQEELLSRFAERQESFLQLNQSTILVIVASIIFLITIIILVKTNRDAFPGKTAGELVQETVSQENAKREFDIEAEEKNAIKKQLDKFASQRPDAVAQLLRNWLSED